MKQWTSVKLEDKGQDFDKWIFILKHINGIIDVKYKCFTEKDIMTSQMTRFIKFTIYFDDEKINTWETGKIVSTLQDINKSKNNHIYLSETY